MLTKVISEFKIPEVSEFSNLGEKISVRKIGEETTKTNAQAAVIALKALNLITGSKIQKSITDKPEDQEEEILLGPQTLEAKASSL